MPKVKLYRDLEGKNVGDTVDVDKERAEFLVVRGYATYAGSQPTGNHLPPVGGATVKGEKTGVEPSKKVAEAVLAPASQRSESLEVKTAKEDAKAYEA